MSNKYTHENSGYFCDFLAWENSQHVTKPVAWVAGAWNRSSGHKKKRVREKETRACTQATTLVFSG